jgi:hypothetical protein
MELAMTTSLNMIFPDVQTYVYPTKTHHNDLLKSSYLGHCFVVIKNTLSDYIRGIERTARKALYVLSALKDDVVTLASVFRKLDKYVIDAIERLAKIPGYLGQFKNILKNTVGVSDFVQVAADVDYFFNCKFIKENTIAVAARISGAIATSGGALLWLEEMSVLKCDEIAGAIGDTRIFNFVPKTATMLASVTGCQSFTKISKLAVAIGEIRVFNAISKISLNFVASRALTLYYIFASVDCINQLQQPTTDVQKMSSSLNLASYLSELVLDALVTVGVTNVLLLGATGTVSISLVLAAFFYKVLHPVEQQVSQPEKVAIEN